MNILNNIENKMATTLETIDGTTTTTGYTFYTKTGTINVYDEAISQSTNTEVSMINYVIEQDGDEERVGFQEGQNSMTNQSTYKVTARVKNTGSETNTKRAMVNRMNDLISDIKYAFGNNITLNKTCNWFIITRVRKSFTEDGDCVEAGTLEVLLELNYSQALYNTDVYACI